MAHPPRQLALALDHAESYAREDFLSGPGNESALAADRLLAGLAGERRGSGRAGGIRQDSSGDDLGVGGGRSRDFGRALATAEIPTALATGALVVEDAATAADERALFHLINLAREENAYLLFTARTTPATWPVAIPDLGLAAAGIAGRNAGSARRCDAARGHRQACRRSPARARRKLWSGICQPISSARLPRRVRRSSRSTTKRYGMRRPATRALAAEIFRGSSFLR